MKLEKIINRADMAKGRRELSLNVQDDSAWESSERQAAETRPKPGWSNLVSVPSLCVGLLVLPTQDP